MWLCTPCNWVTHLYTVRAKLPDRMDDSKLQGWCNTGEALRHVRILLVQVLSLAAIALLFRQSSCPCSKARKGLALSLCHQATAMLLHLLGHITSSIQGHYTRDVLESHQRAVGAATVK
jgi:hypothetical protein